MDAGLEDGIGTGREGRGREVGEAGASLPRLGSHGRDLGSGLRPARPQLAPQPRGPLGLRRLAGPRTRVAG